MFRPATPLALIFLLAFVLLLLSTLSTPIIKGIPLASFEDVDFGVFGYCNTKDGICSSIQIGYDTNTLFGKNDDSSDFSLPSATRHSLSSILVVHPIATFLTLICFALAVAAHFHSPSHSPRFLLGVLILTIPTLLITLLAFLVDILLFVPHMQWGGWIVLAATILIVASSVVTCAMRRTLVSRKARQKRIAENADMNGQNYYENQAQTRMMADTANANALPKAESPPPMASAPVMGGAGAYGMEKGGQQDASYEMQRPGDSRDSEGIMGSRGLSDDRMPLNPRSRDPSVHSTASGRRPYNTYNAPPMPGRPSMDSQGRPRRPSRDQYGNPLPPYGMAPGAGGAGSMHRARSQESLGSNRSYGSRGRGGYGPPPRGYGPSQGRGGYGPPPRGNYAPRGGWRGGPPPPGWNGRGRGGGGYGPPGPPQGMRGPPPMSGRPPPDGFAPPPGYTHDSFYAGGAAAALGLGAAALNDRSSSFQGRSPEDGSAGYVVGSDRVGGDMPPPTGSVHELPIGQAIEMDERTGSMPGNGNSGAGLSGPTYEIPPGGELGGDNSNFQSRALDAERQQNATAAMMAENQAPGSQSQQTSYMPERSNTGKSSVYSVKPAYVPPRQGWQTIQEGSTTPTLTNPMPVIQQASPVRSQRSHARTNSEPYYEDVDPRFAIEEPSDDGFARDANSNLPRALTPGNPGSGAVQTPGSFVASHVPGGFPVTPAGAGVLPPRSQSYGFSNARPQHDPGYLHPRYVQGSGAVGTADSGEPSPIDSYDDTRDGGSGGANSERASETSHFTSISERPVNPNWAPPPSSGGPGSDRGGPAGYAAPGSYGAGVAQQRRREDMILGGNPDFALPGMGPGAGRNRAGSRGATGSAVGPGVGVAAGGRYPTGQM